MWYADIFWYLWQVLEYVSQQDLLIYRLAQQTQYMRGWHYADTKMTVEDTPQKDILSHTQNHSATQALSNEAAPFNYNRSLYSTQSPGAVRPNYSISCQQ